MTAPGHFKTSFFVLALFLSLSLILPQGVFAYWTWSPEAGKFINAEGTAEGPAEEQFKYALRFVDEGKPEKAIDELENLSRTYPSARITADALFQLAVLYEKKSDHMKAFKTYKKIMETYPQSPRIDEVVERTYAIGNLFLSGQKAKVAGFAILPAMPKAIEVFKAITDSAPFSAYGDRALFNLGIAYKKNHRYEDAIKSFQRLIDDYPTSELLSDARFQLADTSFQMSIRRTDRDLRSLDVAEDSAEEFLKEYPDSHMTARAQELVKTIIDKNAEKNFKIGLYYENENYVDSAIIYYEDVTKKYPATVWADKARRRLGQIKDPAKYMKIQEQEIQSRLDSVTGKELAVKAKIDSYKAEHDKEGAEIAEKERKRLEKEHDRLEGQMGALSKSKVQSIRTRQKVLKIKEEELKNKWRNLKAKQKYYKKRMTDDLVKAFKRWEESLKAEEYALQRERADLDALGESWNVRTRPLISLPFQYHQNVKPVLKYKEHELHSLEDKADQLRLQADLLKERRADILEDLEALNQNLSDLYLAKTDLAKEIENAGGDLASLQGSLRKQKAELDALAKSSEGREVPQAEVAGKVERSSVPFAGAVSTVAKAITAPVAAAGKSMSWAGSVMPKFKNENDLTPLGLQEKRGELKLKMSGLKEQITSIQGALLVEDVDKTGSEGEDDLVSYAKENRRKDLMPSEVTPEQIAKTEPRALRKEIRELNRQIRSKYEEVEDRKKHKDALINSLTEKVEEVKESVSLWERSKEVVKPVTGIAFLMKAFIVGLPDKEKEAIKGARSLEAGVSADQVSRVTSLKEEIEYEIIMIDTRHTEILRLEQELADKEALAKAMKIPLQDLSVIRPDYILKSNLERMGRLIAPNTRKEILLNRLDKATKELDETILELEAVEEALQAKEPSAPAPKAKQAPVTETPKPEAVEDEAVPAPAAQEPQAPAVTAAQQTAPSAPLPQAETALATKPKPAIKPDLTTQLDEKRSQYEEARARFEKSLEAYLKENKKGGALKEWEKEKDKIQDERQQLIGERNSVEQELSAGYRKEAETVESIRSLIHEKIDKIDSASKALRFKAGDRAERLASERSELEGRLSKLAERVKTLRDEEIKVLQPLEAINGK